MDDGQLLEADDLEAALGEPVYTRLGYRVLGTLEVWERRSEA